MDKLVTSFHPTVFFQMDYFTLPLHRVLKVFISTHFIEQTWSNATRFIIQISNFHLSSVHDVHYCQEE